MAAIARLISAFMPALKELLLQILVALGISVVTFQGVELVVDKLLEHISSNYMSLDSAVIQLLNLAGIGEAINILLGACTFILSFNATASIFKILNKG